MNIKENRVLRFATLFNVLNKYIEVGGVYVLSVVYLNFFISSIVPVDNEYTARKNAYKIIRVLKKIEFEFTMLFAL